MKKSSTTVARKTDTPHVGVMDIVSRSSSSSRSATRLVVPRMLMVSSLAIAMVTLVSCSMLVEAFQQQPLYVSSSSSSSFFGSTRQSPLETTTRTTTRTTASTTSTALWGGARRGKLGSEIRELADPNEKDSSSSSSFGPKQNVSRRRMAASTADKKKSGSSSNNNKHTGAAAAAAAAASAVVVSPALAQWASAGGTTTSTSRPAAVADDKTATRPSATTFVSFDNDDENDDQANNRKTSKKSSSSSSSPNRRVKQSERLAAEQAWNAQFQVHVQELLNVLQNEDGTPKQKAPQLPDILNPIRKILNVATSSSSSSSSSSTFAASSLRSLAAAASGNKGYDYRLAWVGSDEAICHVGTSLHKVPLARLQEVFLSFPGRNRVQLQEVIRVIGPFPNVRNNLQGQSKSKTIIDNDGNNDNLQEWTITWDSMIDGTGKELMAGTEKDARIVQLQVHVSSPTVLIAVVPPASSSKNKNEINNNNGPKEWRMDPLQDNGRHVLVFVREDDLLDKLESLRVA